LLVSHILAGIKAIGLGRPYYLQYNAQLELNKIVSSIVALMPSPLNAAFLPLDYLKDVSAGMTWSQY